MMKILITGGKSAQSFKVLKAFTDDQVVLADYGELPSLPSAKYSFAGLGERSDDTIAHNLLKACLDQEVDTLLPLYDFEVEAVAKSALLFEEFNIHILLPDAAILPLFYKKNSKSSYHWVVYNKGKVVYTSQPWTAVQEHVLSGAFYIHEVKDVITTTLMTIS